jgi:hypothetical protein
LRALDVFYPKASLQIPVVFKVSSTILLNENISESASASSSRLNDNVIHAIVNLTERATFNVLADEGAILDHYMLENLIVILVFNFGMLRGIVIYFWQFR